MTAQELNCEYESKEVVTDSIESIAKALADSIGHKTTCGILNCKCTCGHGFQQAAALDRYIRWTKLGPSEPAKESAK